CVTVVIVVCAGFHRILHSFPTRRSSDLARQQLVCAALIMDLAMRWRDDDVTASSSRFNQALDLWFAARVQLNALTTGERRIAPKDRKSTRLNSSHVKISYAVFCLKKKNN